jgi:hypothetical protein
MKTRIAIIGTATLISCAVARSQALPPLIHDIEAGTQQAQVLDPLEIQQGASLAYRVRLKSGGKWLPLAGLTARLDIRAASTNTAAIQVTGTPVTNATPHYFAFPVSSTETGTAREDWVYSVAVIAGSDEAILGTGEIDIIESAWTGQPTVPSVALFDWARYSSGYTNTATHGPYRAGSGITATTGTNGAVTLSADTGTTDHSELDNLAWTDSGHTGTPARLAGFFEGGLAGYSGLGSGLYFDGSDNLSISNSVIDGAALGATALQAEADTLQSVTGRGATTTNQIDASRFSGNRFGVSSGRDATGDAWFSAGVNSARDASGDFWSAVGLYAGRNAIGDGWAAFGSYAGESAIGSSWLAIGGLSGKSAEHTNSASFGRYAGRTARGNNRLYVDVYGTDPAYAADGATNDRIFGDSDGTLYLGRGAGAPGGAVGGTLRGPWTGGGFAQSADLAGYATTNSLADRPTFQNTTNIVNAALSPYALAEVAVTGAVTTAQSGYQYYWQTSTNVVLSANLTAGRPVNLALLKNTATNAVNVIVPVGWVRFNAGLTNSIAAGRKMTFGFAIDEMDGSTNVWSTAQSEN